MTKKSNITIAIDTARSEIHYYSIIGKDAGSIEHKIKKYSGLCFDEDFYKQFRDALGEFTAGVTSRSVGKISLILPDNAIALDTVKVLLDVLEDITITISTIDS